jgi:hypothetical protein
MLSILSGVVVAGAGGAGLWYFIPRNGVPHPLTKTPFLDSMIPIAILVAFAVGVSLIVAGLA